jgi:flagellin
MSLVINTNIASLNAQNNLSKSQSALSQATERLSSGLKINSAADNAAGFAIVSRFQTQIGGLNQASSNASDAINLAQTAGSALDQVTSNLQAIRDLAVQAANGSYTDDDRKAIDQEVQQRLQEINRIANQTSFNGTNILNGSTDSLSFQIGANVGQSINVDLSNADVRTSSVGAVSEVSTSNLSGLFVDASGAAQSFALSGLGISGNDGTALFDADSTATATNAQGVVDAINAAGAAKGVSAAVTQDGGITIYSTGALTVDTAGIEAADSDAAAPTFTGNGASGYAGEPLTASGSLDGGSVKTVDQANDLIVRIDAALTSVSNISSDLGAVQNRFQSTIATLTAQSSNLQSSQSSIQDADFAQETANLSKAQVLQQAGISVLATANAQPQQVLKLLQ